MGFLLSPTGRVSRRGLWLGYLLTFVALGAGAYFGDRALAANGAFVLPAQLIALQPALDIVGGPLVLAVLVLVPWASAMMVLKRLHDRGFGGMLLVWKALVLAGLAWLMWNAPSLVPGDAGRVIALAALAIGALMVLRMAIIVLFLAGQDGDNRFGPDPLVR